MKRRRLFRLRRICLAVVLGTAIFLGWQIGMEPSGGQEAPMRGADAEELAPMEEPSPPAGEAGPLPSPPEAEGEVIVPEMQPAEEVQAPEKVIRYTVKEGDTLWDISQAILSDPFLWPKVWRNNPYIQNPDLIYPGNVISFAPEAPPVEEPPPAEAIQPIALPVEEVPPAEVPPAPEVAMVPPVEAPPPPVKPQPDLSLLASLGFILTDQKPSGTIVGSPDDRELLGENEIAYILPALKETLNTGDRLTLYRNVRKVYHPKTRKYLGDLIKILGVAEIIESEERVKTAKILDSYDYSTKGDLVLPYEPSELTAPMTIEAESAQAGSLSGYIVEVKDDRVSNAQFDVVYLDRGLKDGLKRGDRLVVVREGEKTPRFSAGKGERLPRQIIGHLEILMAHDTTATAWVIQSSDVIYKGDRFESPPAP